MNIISRAEDEQKSFSLLDSTLSELGKDPENLITVLQKAQELYGWLSPELIYYVADAMRLSSAKVMGVASFYAQFSLKPMGKYTIMLCQGTACHVNGSKKLMEAVCSELRINDGETSADELFTLKSVACLGCCSLSPVMMINGETFGSLTQDKAIAIIRGIREKEGVK